MEAHRTALLAAALFLLGAAPAAAAPDLTLTASHARADVPARAGAEHDAVHRHAHADRRQRGRRSDRREHRHGHRDAAGRADRAGQPPGRSARARRAASGPGWTCTGTTTTRCTRSDVLAPGAAYPPITITVAVANSAAAYAAQRRRRRGRRRRRRGATATDDIPVAADACPNGWAAARRTRRRADGCTPLDARRTPCRTRVALTFDDGPSVYRPRRSRTCARRACRRRSSTSGCGWRPTRSSSAPSSPTATPCSATAGTTRTSTTSRPHVLAFEVDRDRGALRRARRAVHVQGPPPAVPERQRRDDGRAGGDGLRRHAEPDLRDRLGPGALGDADPRRDRQRAAPRRRDPAPRRPGRLARRAGDRRRRAADHRRRPRARLLLRDRRPRPARSSRTASCRPSSRSPRSRAPCRTSRSPTRARRRRRGRSSRSR